MINDGPPPQKPRTLSAVLTAIYITSPSSSSFHHSQQMSSGLPPPIPPAQPSTDEKVVTSDLKQPHEGESGYPATPAPPEHCQPSRRRRCCRRFGHFLLVALFLWLTARFLMRHCELRRLGPDHLDLLPWDPAIVAHADKHHPPGEIDACVNPSDWTEFSHPDHPLFDVWRRTELSLPSSADDVFLFSRGLHAIGVLHVVEAPDRDDIGVELIVGSNDKSLLFDSTNVCKLHRRAGGHGVGIFTPPFKRRLHDRDVLFFNITLSLPQGKDVNVLPHFETHLPLFHQTIKKLPTHTFGSISLHSFDGPIFAESLVGDKIKIYSSNAPIGGVFNTSSLLKVKTRNAPVDVRVNAFNKDNASPTQIKIHTSNSVIFAHISLVSTHEDQAGGAFVVHARTSNGPLGLNFTDQPPDSLLKLEAHTSNAPARVHLHPAYEGFYKLRTTFFPPVLAVDDNVEDPTGRGRKRVIDEKTVGRGPFRILHGDVVWVPQDEGAPKGKVDVSTTNSPVQLLV
ncbi:hypothetical protein F5148DRAFT_931999 [Russula earlei]|uniref:Uncharacterized protein n=1 Tax=Russula earlei TaxID=71964 RepID=A0ACC0UAH7_9AGAM|nr:hypothetical protein F5148DRAFT_931999 [Russula earlei]